MEQHKQGIPLIHLRPSAAYGAVADRDDDLKDQSFPAVFPNNKSLQRAMGPLAMKRYRAKAPSTHQAPPVQLAVHHKTFCRFCNRHRAHKKSLVRTYNFS